LASGWSPSFGIVAAQRENIADAERRGAEQLALKRDAVAVAAGDLQNRLDAASSPGRCARREARHVGLLSRHRPVTLIAVTSPRSASGER